MQTAHPLEEAIGIGVYVSDGPGVGGHLRERPEDFTVREIETVDPAPLDADRGSYPYLLVRARLRDWDTNDFARRISNRLEISRERVAWAGTKDRRAVSTQLFTIDGITADALPDIPGAELSAIGRFGRRLQFGDLAGNEFTVTISEPTDPDRATAITDALSVYGNGDSSIGVPNFFGQQRFGSERAITHLVGRRILQGDWEGAVMTYVGHPSEYEPERTRSARAFVQETREWEAALEKFHGGLRFERAMLSALAGGATFREALEALPENLQRLFVHAAQSDLFNRIVTRRLRSDLPLDRPVTGDVVSFTETRGGLSVPDMDRTQRVDENRVDVVRRHCRRGRAYITAPLVGEETELGEGEPGEITRSVLQEVGIDPRGVELPDPYRSAGTRRAILVRTDLSMTQADDGDLVASFSLPKGSYATVLLREFLKCDPRSL